MPDLHDHDIPKRDPDDFDYEPRHDSLMSDPDLRKAFTGFEEQGYNYDESYYLARKEIEGENWEPHNPEHYEEETLEKFGYYDRVSPSKDAESPDNESGKSEREDPGQYTLDELVDDS